MEKNTQGIGLGNAGGIQHSISGGVKLIIPATEEITKLAGAQRRPGLIRKMVGRPNTRRWMENFHRAGVQSWR